MSLPERRRTGGALGPLWPAVARGLGHGAMCFVIFRWMFWLLPVNCILSWQGGDPVFSLPREYPMWPGRQILISLFLPPMIKP